MLCSGVLQCGGVSGMVQRESMVGMWSVMERGVLVGGLC